ncbi:MAG: hypothetical protein A6F71_08350 [Cycloclasticus sp. symbiont of Poecilosclerida sp. M]|nr:MAG: hypothetical protein A6F71_08350 [Cycloclasticus sp. symbiont of Poecilosclerida sp. M]
MNADFTIENGDVVMTTQTLGNDETGVIESDGQLNTMNVGAISAPGDDVTIKNEGSVSTTALVLKEFFQRVEDW